MAGDCAVASKKRAPHINAAQSTGRNGDPVEAAAFTTLATMTSEEREDTYRAAVVDLLGVLAYAELTAFDRLADDARSAPTLEDRAALAGMAVAEFGHFLRLRDYLRDDLGVDPEEAMAPFVASIDAFHEGTAPADWTESLVTAYGRDGVAMDVYREVAANLDEKARVRVTGVLGDTGHAEFAVDHVRAAIEADPVLAGRLALWARRLVGEALAQAQRVAVEREALTSLVIGDLRGSGGDLAELGRMFARLTDNHQRRMAALGLAP
jgi:hypothetical protein